MAARYACAGRHWPELTAASQIVSEVEDRIIVIAKRILEGCGFEVGVLELDALFVSNNPASDINDCLRSVEVAVFREHGFHVLSEVKQWGDSEMSDGQVLKAWLQSEAAAANRLIWADTTAATETHVAMPALTGHEVCRPGSLIAICLHL